MPLVTGVVKHRSGRGKKFGFPTANIPITKKVEDGVYISTVYHNKQSYPGVSIASNKHNTIETHIVDYKGEIKNRLTFRLEEKVKDLQHYKNKEEMIESRKRLVKLARNHYKLNI